MGRSLTTLGVLLLLVPLARAQDMPLSQILIDGEGWKIKERFKPPPSGQTIIGDAFPGLVTSPDNATLYMCDHKSAVVDACSRQSDGEWNAPIPYCSLRTRPGEKTVRGGWLATDRDGRIYAATEIGVQVFDPIGRLSGVLTPAAPGIPRFMAFRGDELTIIIDDTMYSRKLNATGTK